MRGCVTTALTEMLRVAIVVNKNKSMVYLTRYASEFILIEMALPRHC